MQNAILLIDPISSTEYSCSRFKELGYAVIAVKTFSFANQHSEKYHDLCDAVIHSQGNLSDDLNAIAKLKIDFDILHGVTGVESNFKYAETLLNACFPNTSNHVSSSHYRCDKYWMNEVLRENNLNSIRQTIISTDLDINHQCIRAIEFYHEHNQHIVIKPKSESAGSVGVFSPHSEQDIHAYFAQEGDFLFQKNDYLLQERLSGDEYYIDSASYCGKHYITSIGKYTKEVCEGQFVYRYVDAIELNTPFADELSEFITQCLDKLHMHHGLAHCEVIHTAHGFKLVELNPRTSGVHGFFNRMAQLNYGFDQISCYLNLLNNTPISLQKNPTNLRLYVFQNMIGAFSHFDMHPITKLKSYHSHKILIEKSNDTSNKSLLGTVALILMNHHDKEQILADTQLIEEYEKVGTCFI